MARIGVGSTSKENGDSSSSSSANRSIANMKDKTIRPRRGRKTQDLLIEEEEEESVSPSHIRKPFKKADSSSRSTTATVATMDANGEGDSGMKRSRSGRRLMPVTRKDDLGGVEEDVVDKSKSNGRRGSQTNSAKGSKKGRQSVPGKRGRKSKADQTENDTEKEEVNRSKLSSDQPAKEESEEDRMKREREEMELMERWHEEYFEIVEQLPLELQRSYSLMREMEAKFQDRIQLIASHAKAYRDARIAYAKLTPEQKVVEAARERKAIEAITKFTIHPDEDIASSDADAEGEDDAEVFHELAGDSLSRQEAKSTESDGLQSVQQESVAEKREKTIEQESNSNSTKESTLNDHSQPHTAYLVPTRAARLSLLASIAQSSSESIKIAEEKVGLAVTAYDWVDRQIRRLDADLQKSENTLLLGLRAGTEASRGLQDALGIDYEKGQGAHRWDDVENLLMGRPSGNRTQSNKVTRSIEERESSSEGAGKKKSFGKNGKERDQEQSTGADMAVDPNEPTYCYCDEVSSGEMVACDNEDCPREWFHLPCVGFSQPPRGRWFCLFCAPVGYKGSGTYPPDAPCLPLHLLAFNPNINGSAYKRKGSKMAGDGVGGGGGRNKRRR